MRHLIPTLLYLAYVNAYQRLPTYPPFVIEDRFKSHPDPLTIPTGTFVGTYPYSNQQYPTYTNPTYSPNQPRFINGQLATGPYVNNPNYGPPPYFLRSNTNAVRSGQTLPKSSVYQGAENFPFDLDYSLNGESDLTFSDSDSPPLLETPLAAESQSYYDDLELVENFGNYLKKRTLLDPSSTLINDAAHQYNALMAVIVALARTIRDSCTEFDPIYDQVYAPTVETYYRYGLANAEKVSALIEGYIQKGFSHMPKIKKLKQELCDKELFCATSVDNHIKSSPLLYVKELETLEAITHLARSFYPYIEEFNQAAIRGTVLPYLQKSKERLKEYILHVINSVEHLSDRQVRCS